MPPVSNKVVHLHHKDEQAALERLNRITGLQFSSWPESLVPAAPASEPPFEQSPAEPLFEQVRQG
ncbi:hypothetical protein AO896_05675 [Pseudomonas aeruginosa]|uniref:Uncharacterized protein n=2 Tax=Pseudomonas aeruginosa group TaxID=136841 RepID=A0ABD7K0Q6_PSEAI|nr:MULTISPECIES: hypothetical protein [Pseudomonas aeruginosa group]ABR81310.1 hypothetical protein PSPA7_4557 [Pseudomonas aeruginosa PA7]KSC53148.1 hypothetical protein AO882_02365 [Pseudomonas paraeruginosa]KSC92848.1 hypothetical protein AO896_05675 [Pseudomonas aeruginosa]KSD26847.1 hypothetical protein AO898_04800 [Pseudomonas aeruginosa]KSG59592.1 hypothetical protein AO955_06760 [Pseudomonas aeruginosa]